MSLDLLLALLVFTQPRYCHGVGIGRSSGYPSSVNSGFSETSTWIQTKFHGKLPICHISRKFYSFFFQNCNFSNFHIFFVFVNIGPYGSQICKTVLLPQIPPEFCETSEFLSPLSSQCCFFGFLNFWDLGFYHFLLFPLIWDHMVG